jgi:hypothetical protein
MAYPQQPAAHCAAGCFRVFMVIITTLHNLRTGTRPLMHLVAAPRAVLATGIHGTFAPVADMARGLRWGGTARRSEQTGRYMVMVGNQSATCMIR